MFARTVVQNFLRKVLDARRGEFERAYREDRGVERNVEHNAEVEPILYVPEVQPVFSQVVETKNEVDNTKEISHREEALDFDTGNSYYFEFDYEM